MHQLGLGLLVGGLVCLVWCAGGYGATHTKTLIGGEPPKWLTLTKQQQEVERAEAMRNVRALWPSFRGAGFLGIGLLVVGALLTALT